MHTTLIQPQELAALRSDDVVIFDVRHDLADATAGESAWRQARIPGARFLHVDRQLSGPRTSSSGRHPLPDRTAFHRLMVEAGVGANQQVVVYDAGDGSTAARLWWMLRWLGHDAAAVLDGGFAGWRRAGLPVTDAPANPTPRRFVPAPRPELVASAEDVQRLVQEGRGVLVDSRAPERYRGELEPIDPVAGHIPGARNLPWMDNVDADGRWRHPGELARRFAGLVGEEPVVVYCGSGVTACANLLAMAYAGVPVQPRLYVGGWSDWCTRPGSPVAKVDT